MTFKQKMMAAFAAGALSVSGAAVAQHGPEMHHGGGMEFLHGVTLTDTQRAQIEQIHKAGRAQMRPVWEQMHAVHEQIETAMLNPGTVTAEQLSPLVQQEEALRSKMDAAMLSEVLQARALLTPTQLAQAADTHAKLAALHEQEHAVMQQSAPAEQ